MSAAEREEFLAGVHAGVLSAAIGTAGQTMAVPVIKVLRRPVESAQYTTIAFTTRLTQAGIDPSVGTVGICGDNALPESQIGLFKTELYHPHGPGATGTTSNPPSWTGSPGSTQKGPTKPSAT